MKKIIKNIIKSLSKSLGLYVRRSSFHENELNKNQVIFVHVPKVAGTALKKSLEFYIDHIHLYTYELEDKEKFEKYFKIGFVRNPWDRLVSAFFYLKQGGNQTDDLVLKDKLNKFNTFEKFVLELDQNIKFRRETLKIIVFSNQYSWLMNSIGEIEMDYIGRFEDLEEGFLILKEKLHRGNAQLERLNTSKHKPYWTYYKKETVEIVRRIYSKDIIAFNYDFPYEKLKSENK